MGSLHFFSTRDYSDSFRKVTEVPAWSQPLAVPRVSLEPHLYQHVWQVSLRAKAVLIT